MKEFLAEYVSNTGLEAIVALLAANFIAQIIKVINIGFRKKIIRPSLFFATGGMPSSHSSTVVAMATSVGLVDGFTSTTYAIAVCFAVVVMFDAAGLRQNAGKQARVLNKIVAEFLSPEGHVSTERLKEFLGHTSLEVFAGAALGIAVSFGLRVAFMRFL
ncbi:MAG: acid phosphatase family membrane protein YuiD [Bacteroidia bacterium]